MTVRQWRHVTAVIFAIWLISMMAPFGIASAISPLPAGWVAGGSAPASYVIGLDPGNRFDGRSSIIVSSKAGADSKKFATAMQTITSADYRGKRVRFRATVRTRDIAQWAGLWMRVDDYDGKILQFDNMHNRPLTGTGGWQSFDVVLDVSKNSTDIAFGALVVGQGTLWLAKPELTAVNNSVPTTSLTKLPREPNLTW